MGAEKTICANLPVKKLIMISLKTNFIDRENPGDNLMEISKN
jgi:hypothetical protein